MSIAALDSYLLPIKQIFDREGVSEISINRPNEVWNKGQKLEPRSEETKSKISESMKNRKANDESQ